MADITYTQFPIEADIVDISQMETDIGNAQTDILSLGQNKADKTTTINGLSLAQNRTLYVQDIPSKNLLPNTAVTKVTNGITFTVNSDGSITATGTASANADIDICAISGDTLLSMGSAILTGCPSGGGDNTYRIRIDDSQSPYTIIANDKGSGATINTAISGHTYYAYIRISSGVAIPSGSPLVFRPMIRLASITDDTYVPYAKTNVELTQTGAVVSGRTAITPSAGSNHSYFGNSFYETYGRLVHVHFGLSGLTANSKNEVMSGANILPESIRPQIQIPSVGVGGATYTAVACGVVQVSGAVWVSSVDTYADIDFYYILP